MSESNRNILLAAYYFPPLGMGGVGRPYALFRHLPKYGYNVYVLTVKDILYPEHDYSLLQPGDAKNIYRAGSFDPARLLYLAGFRKQSHTGYPGLNRKLPLYFPDLKRGWRYFAARKINELIRRHDISAIITTSPPPSAHMLGLAIKKKNDIPWVADFRDYWFPLPIEKVYPDGIMKKYSLKLKDRIVHDADEIVSVNNDIKKYLGRGDVIMNGTDDTIVEQWQQSREEHDGKFVIGALGTFNYLFPIEPLFVAVSSMINSGKVPRGGIRVVHVGHCDARFNELIDKYGLRDVVIMKGYMERSEAIRNLLEADILYLAVNKFENYNILPGRIFDYLVSRKPILGVVPPDSDAATLIEEYPFGSTVTDGDTKVIENILIDRYEKRNATGDSGLSEGINADKYTMSTLAERFASVLDGLLR